MSNYTPEDLLEYFYQETSTERTESIERAISAQWPLQEKYRVITQAVAKLEKSIIMPRFQSVKAILEYAAKFKTAADIH